MKMSLEIWFRGQATDAAPAVDVLALAALARIATRRDGQPRVGEGDAEEDPPARAP